MPLIVWYGFQIPHLGIPRRQPWDIQVARVSPDLAQSYIQEASHVSCEFEGESQFELVKSFLDSIDCSAYLREEEKSDKDKLPGKRKVTRGTTIIGIYPGMQLFLIEV